jgi:CubicO group peptidase (beta-lactamase class C family)
MRLQPRPKQPPPASTQEFGANIQPNGPTGSSAIVASSVGAVQSAAQAGGLNIASLMGYYDDSGNLNYVGLATPSSSYARYQVFAETHDEFYASFASRALTLRLVALHELDTYGWLGWPTVPTAYPNSASGGSGADRTFLQVWIPRPPEPAVWTVLPQTLYFETSYVNFAAQWNACMNMSPARQLELILAYNEADGDRFLGVFQPLPSSQILSNLPIPTNPDNTVFSDFICTTDWDTFRDRLQSNSQYALADFKVYDSQGVRYYLGVWNGPILPGSQYQFGDQVSALDTFLGQSALGTVCGDTYRAIPRFPNGSWTSGIPTEIAAWNAPGVAMGYAWAVGYGGSIYDSGSFGLARSAYETKNPSQSFTIDSRIYLWSLTKLITTAALLNVLWTLDPTMTMLDQPFLPGLLPALPSGSPAPASSVANITFRQLLNYTSGINGSLSPPASSSNLIAGPSFDYAAWTAWMLSQPLMWPPGDAYLYQNVYFDVAAFVVAAYASVKTPAEYILGKFLPNLGVDTTQLNYTADAGTDALEYANSSDTNPGLSVPVTGVYGGTGAIGSVRQVINFLMGLRGNAYPPGLLELMLCGNVGPSVPEGPNGGPLAWTLNTGPFGESCQKDGHGSLGGQGANHGAFHFVAGYDAVLLMNSTGADGMDPIWNAFPIS